MGRRANKIAILVLLGIVLLAGWIRLYQIDQNPPSLYWEEAALGYDAYSISETGKDYHGNSFPITSFPSFGDYKPSVYFYATTLSIKTFGLSEFSIRIPSALAGIAAVLLVMLISKQFNFSKKTSLLSGFLLAISPWSIQFSRAAFEVNLATAFMLLGIYLLLLARKIPVYILGSIVAFTLSMYTYHGMRIISPLIALMIFIFFRKKFSIKHIGIGFILSFILLLPILTNISNPQVSQRFKETSAFISSSAVEKTNQLRDQFGNSLWSRVVYHRYWWWTGEFINNYLKNFSPNFLFLVGDGNKRHGVGEFGVLYHWELFALSYAIYLAAVKKHRKLLPIFLWILITPMATAMTKTNPHALRMLPSAPAFTILSAYAIIKFINQIKFKKIAISLISLVILAEVFTYTHFYHNHYPTQSSKEWQYGYKQAIQFIEERKNDYGKIYFTRDHGRPSIYALLYGKYDPRKIQSIESSLKKDQLELLEFEKYIFDTPPKNATNSLVVTSSRDQLKDSIPIHTINFLDGEEAFLIYEI